MRKRRMILGALIGGALTGAAGFFLGKNLTPRPEPSAQAVRLPPFSMPTSSGGLFHSDTISDRVIIINFWATWCAPCRREIPLLIATQAIHKGSITVIGIAIDDLEAVQIFEDEIGLDYTSLVGKTPAFALLEKFGNAGQLPFTLVFDKRRNLRFKKTGEITAGDIDDWVNALL